MTYIQGVSAGEMAEVFHTGELKLKWDHTIEADKMLETLDDHCAVYHQILKRVWPTAQRDIVYASHKQQVRGRGGGGGARATLNHVVLCFNDHPTWNDTVS